MAGFFKNYSIAVILLFITGCANMQPPDGGEVDRIPPEVVDVTPANGTTLFKGQEIELKFSEYVDKRTFKDAVFISPALEKGFEVEWSGKTATIIFNEELKPDVTYNITIGTSVIDINNSNNMAKAYSYAISTGDVLDKGTIQGRIYDKDPNKVFVFAYSLGNPEDSLLKRKPDYVTQVGPSGEYILSGLAQGDYRLFAVGNSFGDLIYNLNTDRIGILNRDVKLAQNDTAKGSLDFQLTKLDTIPPVLQKAVMTDQNHLLLSFNEDVKATSLIPLNIQLADTSGMIQLTPKYVYQTSGKTKDIALAVTGNVDPVKGLRIRLSGVRDIAGNESEMLESEVPISDKKDTTPVSISQITPADLNNVQIDSPEITFILDDGTDLSLISQALQVTDTSKKGVKFEVTKLDDASFKVKINQRLSSGYNYLVKTNLKDLVDAAGNWRDTVITTKFTVYNSVNFTGLSGNIKGVTGNFLVVLEDPDNTSKRYTTPLNINGDFEFTEVIPGKYKLWIFDDRKGNKEYYHGSLNPYEHSARFFVLPTIIELIPRWVTFDFKWNVD